MADQQPNLDSLFLTALGIESPEERAAFLEQSSGADESLRKEVKRMLASHKAGGSFLEKPLPDLMATLVPTNSGKDLVASPQAGLAPAYREGEAVVIGSAGHSVLKSMGQTIDIPRVVLRDEASKDPIVRPKSPEIPKHDSDSRYQLHGEIARGGMGAILKGRDTDLGRDLAIKVLLDAHKDKPEVIQRFVEEAQIGGQLQHPGIAPIYELGQFADKRPFFAMKLVKGETLSKLLANRESAADERGKFIGIFEQICQTMAYAHSRGVIHRDLKPANVMVGAFGEVQVMDWGLAKVLAAGGIADEKKSLEKQTEVSIIRTLRSVGSDSPLSLGSVTQMGSVMGTPAYMSPEQALGEIDRLDERTDVFGLGSILCEILTGKPPYVAASGEQVFRLASRGKIEDCYVRLDASEVDAELIEIVHNALALEPNDRLRDAGELSKRISSYIESVDNRLKQAELDRQQAVTRSEEAYKRQRVMFALAASLLIGAIVSAWFAFHATNQKNIAQTAIRTADMDRRRAETSQQAETVQRQQAETARNSEAEQRSYAEKARDDATALSVALEREKQELSLRQEELRRMLYVSDMNLIQTASVGDNASRINELLNAHRPKPGQSDLRNFEWHYWNRLYHSDLRTRKLPVEDSDWPPTFSLSKYGTRVATIDSTESNNNTPDEVLKVWNVQTGDELVAVRAPGLSSYSRLLFSPDGGQIAIDSNGIMNVVGGLKFQMFDIATKSFLFKIDVPGVGQRLKTVWFSDDSSRMATVVNQAERDAEKRSIVIFWSAKTGAELDVITLGSGQIDNFDISPDGSRLAFQYVTETAEADANGVPIQIMEIVGIEKQEFATRKVVTIPCAQQTIFLFGPDGKRLYVAEVEKASGQGGTLFDVESGRKLFSLQEKIATKPSFSPDGDWLAYISTDYPRMVKLLNFAGDHPPLELRGHLTPLQKLAFSNDSQYLFTVAKDGHIKTWDLVAATRARPNPLIPTSKIAAGLITEFSNDGRLIATAPANRFASPTEESMPNKVSLHDDSGAELFQTAELSGPIKWLKFNSDGRRMAASAVDPKGELNTRLQIAVWDTALGNERFSIRLPGSDASAFALSPDGNRLVALFAPALGSLEENSIKIWDVDTGRVVWESAKFSDPLDLKFSPDGRRILGSNFVGTMVWDAEIGRLLWSTQGEDEIASETFSDDSTQLLQFSLLTGRIVLRNMDSGRELRSVNASSIISNMQLDKIVLSPDGRKLAFVGLSNAGQVLIWNLERPDDEPFKLFGYGEVVRSFSFSPDNRRFATSVWVNSDKGEIKLWDSESRQELLTLPGSAYGLAFDSVGTTMVGMIGSPVEYGESNSVLKNVRTARWDAGRLSPQVEAEQVVGALTSQGINETLPLTSEILERINQDRTLSDETRAAAIALMKALRWEKKMLSAAEEIAILPDQPKEKYERATRYLSECNAVDSNNPRFAGLQGLVCFRQGQWNQALASLERAKELNANKKLSRSFEELTILAMALHRTGKIEEALSTLEQVATAASYNEFAFQKLLKEAEQLLNPPKASDHPNLWIGKRFMSRVNPIVKNDLGSRIDAPMPYVIRSVNGNTLSIAPQDVLQNKLFVERSQVMLLEEASRYYSNLIQLEPSSDFPYFHRGQVSRALGDFDQAVEDLSTAIGIYGGEIEHWVRGMILLEDKKEVDKAIADFNESLRINPLGNLSHVGRGMAMVKRGELDNAMKSFEEAIRLRPDDGWVYARRAYSWSAKGERDQMMQDLDKAVEVSPEVSYVWSTRAWLLATSPVDNHRDGNLAVAAAKKAWELPMWSEFRVLDVLAAAYAEAGDFAQAVKWQEKVVSMLPPSQRSDYESRLALYWEGKPFRESAE